MKQHYQKFKALFKKYERFLIPGMLVLGFLVDLLTFKALDIRTAFLLIGVHITLVGFAIAFLNSFDERVLRKNPKHPLRYVRLIVPLILQFSFGALLSAVMIFYLFSGSIAVSWPFLLIVVFLMISNEIYREYYLQPRVQLPVYYLILFAIGALVLPFFLKQIGFLVFALSGLIAMVLVRMLFHLIRRFVPTLIDEKPRIYASIIVIYIVMLLLYLTNIIPPIPLSLRDIGVYHTVSRTVDGYLLEVEEQRFIDRLLPGQTLTIVPGRPLYVFASIFAPTDLETRVVHVWDWYDTDAEEWKTMNELEYTITGGRDDGYRGFTQKSSLLAGKWRVSVTTQRGQVLGRTQFRIKYADTPVPTKIIVE